MWMPRRSDRTRSAALDVTCFGYTWIPGLKNCLHLSYQQGLEYYPFEEQCLHVQGSSSEGLELLSKAEAVFREIKDINGLANTLVRRATVYRFLGNYTAALHDADEALQLTESSDQMQTIHAHALRQKGLILFRQGQSRQAVKILERALESYNRMEDTSHIPILMMETGMAYAALGKEDETIRSQ
jgi:tetratricopeptide (TPR) repeat protein